MKEVAAATMLAEAASIMVIAAVPAVAAVTASMAGRSWIGCL